MSIPTGLKGRADSVVTEQNTAQAACSGALPVFGTPFLCALMEKAAWTSLVPYLEEDQGTVGTKLDISHDSATPLGMKVWAEAEITGVSENSRMVQFQVTAWDEKGPIGKGIHTRAVIQNDRFLAKCNAKLEG